MNHLTCKICLSDKFGKHHYLADGITPCPNMQLLKGKTMNRILYNLIPEHDQYALEKYFEARIPVSGFLNGVLTSNVVAMAEYGAPEQLIALPQYIRFINDHATKGSWGSATAVRTWLTEATNTRGAYAKRKG